MPNTMEHSRANSEQGRRHILADDGIREAYHEVRKIRLQGAANAAGVVRPEHARAAREQALEDVETYHIPVDSEAPKL